MIATSVPDASALKDPLTKAAAKGIEIITVNSGEGAFDDLKTYEVHVGQDEEIAGEGAGKQFNDAGAKNVVVVIHEASNSGLTDRAKGVKKTFKGTTKTLLIPNAKADIPGTQAKIKAYFAANKGTDALLGLDPDVTVPAQQAAPSGTKVGTFDVNPAVITAIKGGKMLFAIDQQQYLQGYLPVVFAVLFVTNLEHRRRRPARAHRPGHHQQGERREGRRARREGHALAADARGVGGIVAAHPRATRARHARDRSHRPDAADERLARVNIARDARRAARHRRGRRRDRRLLPVRLHGAQGRLALRSRHLEPVARPVGAVRDRRRAGRAADDRRRVRPLGRRHGRQLGPPARRCSRRAADWNVWPVDRRRARCSAPRSGSSTATRS